MSWAETKTIWDRIESARSSLASTLSGIATNASTAASKATAAATDAATAATKATAAATDAAAAKTNAANAQLSSARLGYIDRIANGTYGLDKIQALVATNNTASTTGILSQKLSHIINSGVPYRSNGHMYIATSDVLLNNFDTTSRTGINPGVTYLAMKPFLCEYEGYIKVSVTLNCRSSSSSSPASAAAVVVLLNSDTHSWAYGSNSTDGGGYSIYYNSAKGTQIPIVRQVSTSSATRIPYTYYICGTNSTTQANYSGSISFEVHPGTIVMVLYGNISPMQSSNANATLTACSITGKVV